VTYENEVYKLKFKAITNKEITLIIFERCFRNHPFSDCFMRSTTRSFGCALRRALH
jgi:hypothetical protein